MLLPSPCWPSTVETGARSPKAGAGGRSRRVPKRQREIHFQPPALSLAMCLLKAWGPFPSLSAFTALFMLGKPPTQWPTCCVDSE